MKKGFITSEIKNRISKMPRGAIVTIDTFPKSWSRGAVLKALVRLYENGLLERHTRGVYSKAIDTRFGKASASELEVISNLATHTDRMFGGLFLFNNLGLTNQNPSTIEVLNNNSTYDAEIGNVKVHFRRIKPKITEGNKHYIELMEVLRELTSISDSNSGDVVTWIITKVKHLSDTDERVLFGIAKKYPPRLRALLGALVEEERNSLATKLKETLKATSVYRTHDLSPYIKNPDDWRLHFETSHS